MHSVQCGDRAEVIGFCEMKVYLHSAGSINSHSLFLIRIVIEKPQGERRDDFTGYILQDKKEDVR